MSEVVLFWRESAVGGWMSNWSSLGFSVGGKRFATGEHWLTYQKAAMMGDEGAAARILRARTPREAKAMGRRVLNYDDELWKERRFDVMVQGLRHKVRANGLEPALRATGTATIAEASPFDRTWGIGMCAADPGVASRKRWGQNLLGRAWMVVRDEL